MRLLISDQYQPRPYLAPFSHPQYIRDGQRQTTDDNRTISSIFT